MIISAALVCGILIYGWVWLVNRLLNPLIKKSEGEDTSQNPYIQAHLQRRRNDKDYEQYLQWLDTNGGDLPIDKILTKEEWEFKQQLENSGF